MDFSITCFSGLQMEMALTEFAIKAIPIIVILILLLPPFKQHILVAGFFGALFAIGAGQFAPGMFTEAFFGGLSDIMSITSVMIFAATALTLAEFGAIDALLGLLRKASRGRIEIIAGGMVLIQGMATYAAGLGAANLLVTAPLVYAALGGVRGVIAALGIISSVSWATSPASAEAAFISSQMGITASQYSAMMRPYTFAIWAIAVGLAIVATWRAKKSGDIEPGKVGEMLDKGRDVFDKEESDGTPQPPSEAVTDTDEEAEESKMEDLGTQLRKAAPFMFLLTAIVVGPAFNEMAGFSIFTPLTTAAMTIGLLAVLVDEAVQDLGETFVESAIPILKYLFMVGVFLGYIMIIREFGTFEAIASVVGILPLALVGIGAIIFGFLVAIPAGAYTVALLTIIIPTLEGMGVPVEVYGFLAIATAQGAMISPVQISVTALAHGFEEDILDIVKNNIPYMIAMLGVTIALAVLFGGVI